MLRESAPGIGVAGVAIVAIVSCVLCRDFDALVPSASSSSGSSSLETTASQASETGLRIAFNDCRLCLIVARKPLLCCMLLRESLSQLVVTRRVHCGVKRTTPIADNS